MTAGGQDGDLVVSTTGGLVAGVVVDGYDEWRGIPYAAPPVGDLRLRAPAPVVPWQGVRRTEAYGSAPWPTPAPRTRKRRAAVDEDCLTVNVTRRAGGGTGRPVVVYLYGGGNRTGRSSMYPGSRLVADSDLVAVTFNFRIGVLGFLDLAGLPGGEDFDSNIALRDQLAALTWVQQNIAAFGGDPGNVTIFGESAGALAVTTLLGTPAAAGLFARAVSASSPAFHVYSRDRARAWALQYLSVLGVDPTRLADIRAVPAATLISAAAQFDRATQQGDPGSISVSYVVDDDLLPERPVDAIRGGRGHRVPLLIGTCRDEHTLFEKMMKRELARTPEGLEHLVEASGPEVLARVTQVHSRERRGPDHPRIGGEAAFWYPSIAVAEAQSDVATTRMFRIDHAPRITRLFGLGATHGSDVALLFGALDGPGRLLGGTRADQAFVGHLSADLISFARAGVPRSLWPEYERTRRATLVYTTTTAVVDDPDRERREAWTGFVGYR